MWTVQYRIRRDYAGATAPLLCSIVVWPWTPHGAPRRILAPIAKVGASEAGVVVACERADCKKPANDKPKPWGMRGCGAQSLPVPSLVPIGCVLRRCLSYGKWNARTLTLAAPSGGGARGMNEDTWVREERGRIGGKLHPETCPASNGGRAAPRGRHGILPRSGKRSRNE